jgi:hypothetical protein
LIQLLIAQFAQLRHLRECLLHSLPARASLVQLIVAFQMSAPAISCTCTYTIWDDDWDPFLRRILISFSPYGSGFPEERDRDRLAEALNAADCRTIQAAKSLDSNALNSLPQELRQSFLQKIADAEVLGMVNLMNRQLPCS